MKHYLDGLNELDQSEAVLDKESKTKMKKSLDEYSKGEYFTFDQVFEKNDNDV